MPARRTRKATKTTYRKRRTVRNKKRFSIRKLIKPLLFFAALATIGAGCYYTVTTPKLSIRQVKVNGTVLLKQDVLEAETWHTINSDKSIVGKYKNILFLSKSRITAHLLKKHPELASAEAGRVLPNKVIVNVKERKAVAVVTNGDSRWLVSKDYKVFHRVYDRIPWLPTIGIVPSAHLPAPPKAVSKLLNDAVDCVGYARQARLKIDKISIDQAGNLCLNMGSEFYVKLGQPVDLQQKIEQLSTIIAGKPDIIDEGLYIDITCKERPACVFKADAAAMQGNQNAAPETTPKQP